MRSLHQTGYQLTYQESRKFKPTQNYNQPIKRSLTGRYNQLKDEPHNMEEIIKAGQQDYHDGIAIAYLNGAFTRIASHDIFKFFFF